MILTNAQQALLDGAQGETMAKVVKTLVMYGEAFGAERMVPITSQYGHTVISFGIGVMKPVYELYDTLLQAGAVSKQPFSADPRPLDKNIPSSFLQNLVFKFMYSQQERYEAQLAKLGLMGEDAFTCACYLPEAGNVPQRGDDPLLGGILGGGVCQQRPGRPVQPEFRHHRADGLHGRALCRNSACSPTMAARRTGSWRSGPASCPMPSFWAPPWA